MTSRTFWRGWTQLAADLNRLNHILIPATKEERDRWRASRLARAVRTLLFALGRFTDDGQILLLFALLAGVFALDVRGSDVYMAWALLTGFLTASWVHSYSFALCGVHVDVSVPRRVTVGDETTFVVGARNRGRMEVETLLVRGPFLPWDGEWIERRGEVASLSCGAHSRVELRARFRSRGEHHLDPFRVQALVPFGIALGPARVTEGVRFLVVPRIANVVSLELPVGRRHQPGGLSGASSTGDSRELMGVRPYRFGDPIRDLHARTWARVGQPVVREYREEYFSRVGIVLDTDLGRAPDARLEAAISLVAGMVDRLCRTEALVDLIVVGSTAYGLSVGRGLGTLDRALELLARVGPEGPFDPSALTAGVLPRLSSVSCLVLVALRWDAPRRAFADQVTSTGTSCVPVVLTAPGEDAEASPGVVAVPLAAIEAGHPVSL
ncbi:MAG: DUF58 domain-containing protein [Myxococcota bacterium]|nr:DUF58 domain-containing protein [Myxococcota bacterium]